MKLGDLKIGTKLMGSFLLVSLLFAGAILFQIDAMGVLGVLQDDGAVRADDAVKVSNMVNRVLEVYPIVADAIINQNLDESRRLFAEAKAKAEADMAAVMQLSDTPEEKRDAEVFAKAYTQYLGLFDKEMMPVLEGRQDMAARAMDMVKIKDVVGRLGSMYSIFADAIINLNLSESATLFAEAKVQAEADIKTVNAIVDTEQERANAAAFAQAYEAYMNLFEKRLMPHLRANGISDMSAIQGMDEELDFLRDKAVVPLEAINSSLTQEMEQAGAIEQTIRDLDGKMDVARDAVIEPLAAISTSLHGEMGESDAAFNDEHQFSVVWASGISIATFLLAMLAGSYHGA